MTHARFLKSLREGILELRLEKIDEVSVVPEGANRGAKILFRKTRVADADATERCAEKIRRAYEVQAREDSTLYKQEVQMASLSEIVTKALEQDAGDTEREAVQKAVIAKSLKLGYTTVEKIAAETALESVAKSKFRADPSRSFEQHYVTALTTHPELARMLD